MPKSKKPWQEKLADSKDLPKVVKIPEKMAKRLGKGTLVIPAPKEVDEMAHIGLLLLEGFSSGNPKLIPCHFIYSRV